MKDRLLNHPFLKAASLVVAFAVWLIIMNISNPVITKTVSNIPVNVTNVSYVESMNLSYALANGYDTVSVTIEASRSVAERLTASNITATADLTQIIDMNSNPVLVPVTVSVPGVSPSAASVYPRNVQIRLEEMVSKDFVINAVAVSTPARGFEVGTLTAYPEKVTIRGPKSLVKRIDQVQAEVDVTGLDADASLKAVLHTYDKNGDELSESRINNLTYSESTILVDVDLYRVRADVAIETEAYGKPADGYYVGDISVTPQTISVAGTDEALEELASVGNRILITEESRAVDISGASTDDEVRVNLSKYLPDGISLASGLSDTVVVTVKILEFNTKSIEIESKNIAKTNLEQNLNAVFDSSTVDIRIKGSDEALETLSADAITAKVDLTDFSEGTFMVPVEVELPEGFSLAEEPMIELTITETTVLPVVESLTDGLR